MRRYFLMDMRRLFRTRGSRTEGRRGGDRDDQSSHASPFVAPPSAM